MQNPCEFLPGSIIQSVYSGIFYRVVRHLRNGMCVLEQLDFGVEETWNGYNNRHFVSVDAETSLIILLINSYVPL